MRDHAAGGENDRVLLIGHLGRGTPFDRDEVGFAVRMTKLSALIQARSSWMVLARDKARKAIVFLNAAQVMPE